MRLFAPKTPHEEWAEERERIARKRPHLALVDADPRPEPRAQRDPFEWRSVDELFPEIEP